MMAAAAAAAASAGLAPGRGTQSSGPRRGARPHAAMSYTNSNFIAIETYAELNDTMAANETLFDYYAEQVAAALYIYCTPLLVFLGTIGNLVSVFVFYSSKLRLQSTSQYLSALAISDTVFLLQLLPPWMNTAKISDIFNQQGFCQIFQYLTYVTCCLSAWLVVAFTVERFVAVLYPLQRNSICTIKRARHIIGTIVVASLLLNVPMLWLVNPTITWHIDTESKDYAATFNIVDTAMAFTIPLAVIIVLNSWITVGVCRLERARHQLLREQGPAAAGAARAQRARPPRAHASPRSQQRVTRMLLIVSTVFVVLNMPAYTVRLLTYAYNLDPEQENFGRWVALQQIAQMFFYTNFGVNFILYCLSGQNFRRALKLAMLAALRRRARRAAVVRRGAGAGAASHATRACSVNTSFVSNCTEGSTNCAGAGAVVTPTATSRRRRRDPVVTRWTFDNSRQRAYPPAPQDYTEEVEMQVFPSTTEWQIR